MRSIVTGMIALGVSWWVGEAAFAATAKEALAREIRGKFQLKGNKVEVRYDFRDAAQGKDFLKAEPTFYGLKLLPGKAEPLEVEAGRLVLPVRDQVTCTLPLEAIEVITFQISGVREMSWILVNGKEQVEARLGNMADIYIAPINKIKPGGSRTHNLDPIKNYAGELVFEPTRVVLRLDGKEVLEKELPVPFEPMARCGLMIEEGTRPVLTAFQVKGTLRKDALSLGQNRGLAKEGKAPIFDKPYTAKGSAITVISEVSQENADRWLAVLEKQRNLLRDACPSTTSVAAPKRTLHVFAAPHVRDAYLEGLDVQEVLPNGEYCIALTPADPLNDKKGVEARPEFKLLFIIATDLLAKAYPNAPFWWSCGHGVYASLIDFEKLELSSGAVPMLLAARVLHREGAAGTPELADLMRGDSPSQKDYWLAAELSGAWVAFLRHGESEAHRPLLGKFHEELQSGKGSAEAAFAVFPASVFQDLYGKFTAFLKDTGAKKE